MASFFKAVLSGAFGGAFGGESESEKRARRAARAAAAAPPPPEPKKKPPAAEKRGRKAQLIALKATGPGGLIGEENIARRKILV